MFFYLHPYDFLRRNLFGNDLLDNFIYHALDSDGHFDALLYKNFNRDLNMHLRSTFLSNNWI